MRAIADEVIGFEMPGATMAGFRRNSMIIAKAGIYDLRLHHDDVIMPVLRHWDVFDRTGLGRVGEQARDELATFLEGLDAQATDFVERRAENRARDAARRRWREPRHRLLTGGQRSPASSGSRVSSGWSRSTTLMRHLSGAAPAGCRRCAPAPPGPGSPPSSGADAASVRRAWV